MTPEIPRKLDLLRRHCDEVGTDFERIERTCAFVFDADGPRTRELLDRLRGFADAGIDTVIGRVTGLEQRTPIEQLVRHLVPAAPELPGRR